MWGEIAAAVGSTALGSVLNRQKPQGYSKGDLDYIAAQRRNQIGDFANQLSAARNRYLAQLPQFQNYAFNQFAPQAESMFAGRGLSVTGGAFQSELAKKAAAFQAEQMLSGISMEREDLNAVNNAYGNLSSNQLGGSYSNFGTSSPNPLAQGLGQLGSTLMTDAFDQRGSDRLSSDLANYKALAALKANTRGSVVNQAPLPPIRGR